MKIVLNRDQEKILLCIRAYFHQIEFSIVQIYKYVLDYVSHLQSISHMLPYHSLLLYCHLHYMYTHLGTKHGIYHTDTYTWVSY